MISTQTHNMICLFYQFEKLKFFFITVYVIPECEFKWLYSINTFCHSAPYFYGICNIIRILKSGIWINAQILREMCNARKKLMYVAELKIFSVWKYAYARFQRLLFHFCSLCILNVKLELLKKFHCITD